MRKVSAFYAVGLVCTALAGCGKPQFPESPVKPVKGFSLGTAQVQPLGAHPTAEDVYNAAVTLYDSLSSAAATCDLAETMTSEWAEAQGRLADLADKPIKARVDFRYVRPDKVLVKRTGDESLVTVQNGTGTIMFHPERMTYERVVTSKSVVEAVPPSVTGWLQLLPGDRMVGSMRLADGEVEGTETYVLEISLPSQPLEKGYLPAETRTFYLGKQDLLPRKMEITREVKGSKGESVVADRVTLIFSGFTANVKIPSAVFSTQPPKGAKLQRTP